MWKDFTDPEEQRLLADVPAWLSITDMLKATPREEGGKRFVYIEASNESVDYQGEVVLAKALEESSDYYLRYGNLDLDHYTQIGHKLGIANPELFEIGRPVEVRASAGSTFVKGEIFTGEGVAAERANIFWSSMTMNPPARWYPSVGGKIISKSVGIDPVTKAKRAIVEAVRWTNIGFSKTPVNLAVPEVATAPFGILAKSMCAEGLDISKALEAGYGTDSAALAGGGSLRKQSLEPGVFNYWDFRDDLAKRILDGSVNGGSTTDLAKVAQEHFGLSSAEAVAAVERFLLDLKNGSN